MTARLRHLTRADARVVPWKNGGGSTTEIAVRPEGTGTTGAFLWRLSVAEIAASGPFSEFPGIDRIIVQLSGPAVSLDHGADGAQPLTPLVPYRFRGEWKTSGQLAAGGSATDFNVMVRRGDRAAHLDIVHLASGRDVTRMARQVTAAYAVSGHPTVRQGIDTVCLAPGDTALLEGAPGTPLAFAGDGTLLLVNLVNIV